MLADAHSLNQYPYSQKESLHFRVVKDKIYLKDYTKEAGNSMNNKLCHI